uniref:Uncharacterized protein n=1 Tax=Alexandrium catenella TaxID=2925 RepID=A0A7S1RBL5_ALECA
MAQASSARDAAPRSPLALQGAQQPPAKMGSGLSCKIQDSIVTPGKESVVSDPIEVDYDKFLDEILAFVKYPIPPEQEPVLKSVVVNELNGPDEFEVTVTLDGPKLTSFNVGNPDHPDCDFIAGHVKFIVDRAGRKVVSENNEGHWVGDAEKLALKTFITFTKDPLRVDYYWEMPDGSRKVDSTTKQLLEAVIQPAVAKLTLRKVTVDVDEGKKVFKAGPIDASLATYDTFFDGMLAIFKEAPGTVVEELSETKFKVVVANDDQNMGYTVYNHDKDKGTVEGSMFSADGTKKTSSTVYTIGKSPLTFEAYSELAGGERMVGVGLLRRMQDVMDATLNKAKSSGSIFGGLFG